MSRLTEQWKQGRANRATLTAAVDEYERAVTAEHAEMVAVFGEDEVKQMKADGRYRSGPRVEVAAERAAAIYEAMPWWQRH